MNIQRIQAGGWRLVYFSKPSMSDGFLFFCFPLGIILTQQHADKRTKLYLTKYEISLIQHRQPNSFFFFFQIICIHYKHKHTKRFWAHSFSCQNIIICKLMCENREKKKRNYYLKGNRLCIHNNRNKRKKNWPLIIV